jgi:hypothetical protein
MPKAHHGVIAILGPFAHEPDPDEQREQDDGHDEDDFLDAVFHALRDGDQEMTRALMQLGQCFQQMAHRAHVGDEEGLTRSYHECREVLDHLCGDDSEDDRDG